MIENGCYVGIDLGAGSGAKMGLFESPDRQTAKILLPRDRYGSSCESLSEAMSECVVRLLEKQDKNLKDVKAVGLSTPGLLASDRSYVLAVNLGYLNGRNLPEALEQRLGVPVAIENDANAGALAEWSAARSEILYWVLGGGWGGAWVSKEGDIRFAALDWDGDDASLHLTNEPGYATPLSKKTVKTFLQEEGGDFEHFLEILRKDIGAGDGPLSGPSGDPETLRSEWIVSGPGRHRLFRTLTRDDRSYEEHLNADERETILDSAKAGILLSQLSENGLPAAVATDRLFARLLAEAAETILRQALEDGCRPDLPIFLGGKPSRALPYFSPLCQSILDEKGFACRLLPSVVNGQGLNPNLVGAAVLAAKRAE